MGREIKKRSAKEAIAIIVDGQTEKWYLAKVKDNYPCTALKTVKVKPELPEYKRIQDLFDLAKNKLDEEYTFVILIVDLDEPRNDSSELAKFNDLYGKYLLAKKDKLSGKQKDKYAWMKNILVIVNNPCFEYWHLLHFGKTNKSYKNYKSLLPDLKKKPNFANYDKTDSFYNNTPNIFERLGGIDGLIKARDNAVEFDLKTLESEGCSEMNAMFEYFDQLK